MERFGESFFYWCGVVFVGMVLLAVGLTIWVAVSGYLSGVESGSSEVIGDEEDGAENVTKSSLEYGLSGAKWSDVEETVLKDEKSEDVKPEYDKLR